MRRVAIELSIVAVEAFKAIGARLEIRRDGVSCAGTKQSSPIPAKNIVNAGRGPAANQQGGSDR